MAKKKSKPRSPFLGRWDIVSMNETFPAIAKWVRDHGWIEVGQQELFGFVASALYEGGTQVEINEFMILAESMAELELGLVRWFEEEGARSGSRRR